MAEKSRILLVDDEPDIVEVFAKRLQLEGYEVLMAIDGEAALAKARQEKPDLIILDLMLPKMDGYKVCSFLKKDSRSAQIPIIIVTARIQDSEEKLGYECGANAYFTKPFDSTDLMAKIRSLLEVPK